MIEFKPLTKSDIPLIKKWNQLSHIQKFWSSPEHEESYEEYILKLEDDSCFPFLVLYQEKPAGYIQYYWASKVGDGWWEGYPEDVVGIDFYIGEPSLIGKGIGKKMIVEFCSMLFNELEIERIIADPSPENLVSHRTLLATGFKNSGEILTPDGAAILFTLSRS